jgi:hypothetical protein
MNLLSTTTKTGPSFSIAAMVSCPGKTKLCEKLCYTETGFMAWLAKRGY